MTVRSQRESWQVRPVTDSSEGLIALMTTRTPYDGTEESQLDATMTVYW